MMAGGLTTISILLIQLFSFQDKPMKEKAYQLMLKNMLSHSVEEVAVDKAKENQGAVWLDARERNEYDVSRIGDAKWVGYDDFEMSRVAGIEKDADIIVYCSIGYRSEKVAEKLKQAGFTSVKNLYGGIFSWMNSDYEVKDSLGQKTQKIHAYNKLWGKWLEKGEKVY